MITFLFDRILCKKIKRGQSKAQQQYIQGFFKKNQCQSTPQWKVGQQISSPEPDCTGQSSQKGPARTTPAAIYPQQTDHENMSNFYKNSLDTHTHIVCLNNERSWEQLLSVQWLLIIKRDTSCPGTCAVPFLCHPTCVGAHDFTHQPPLTGSCPPVPPH